MIVSGILFAQNSPIDFETGGYGATWTWTVFENDNNPSLEIMTNPNIDGINSSSVLVPMCLGEMVSFFREIHARLCSISTVGINIE